MGRRLLRIPQVLRFHVCLSLDEASGMNSSHACYGSCVSNGRICAKLSIDDIERWFAELANSASVLRRHELVERIAAAVSRFVMIDEDILCPSLFESLKGGRGKEDSETSPTFLL